MTAVQLFVYVESLSLALSFLVGEKQVFWVGYPKIAPWVALTIVLTLNSFIGSAAWGRIASKRGE